MYSDIFCKVYNEFGWNYYPEAFAGQLLTWLERRQLRPNRVLDLGCGTGVLCRELHRAGLEVMGMDYSQGMVAIARQENPQIPFYQGDMTCWQPEEACDLVTCTGDVLNHIPTLEALSQIFRRVGSYVNPGGYLIFDLLNEREVSDSEPFEMDFSETVRAWFQMTRPGEQQVNLKVRVFENGAQTLEENIRETIHSPEAVARLLEEAGFTLERISNTLLEDGSPGTTWFVIARRRGI